MPYFSYRPSSASYDTIIIGLGAAGATAASTLAQAGKKILALEAQDRIGGRVKSVPFGDGVVEEGAEWIHGTENNHVFDTAIKSNLSVWQQRLDTSVYNSDGRAGDDRLFNELFAYYYSISNIESNNHNESKGAFVSRRLLAYLKEYHPHVLKNQYLVNEYLDIMNVALSNDFGSNDWNDVSAQTPYKTLNGTQYNTWHRYGYKTYFDILLNTYNGSTGWPTLDIKLNSEVTKIKWPQNSTGRVEVVCKDGEVYTADNVIVTISLGVLKERHINLFSPSLPHDKIAAINKIAFGFIGKIILAFKEKWWNSDSYVFFYLPGDKDMFKNNKWLIKIREATPPAGASNTLTLWTTGDITELVELLPEDVVRNKCMDQLRQFLGRDMTISEPTGMLRSTWATNPFIRGAYSYDDMSLEQYPNARTTLGEPLVDVAGNPRVLFAGEATDVTHFATVHGARDSGHREAMRLLNVNK